MPKKPQPAIRSLLYVLPTTAGSCYLDLARDLSIINRRGYDQGMQYFIESMEWTFTANPATYDLTRVWVGTAGDSWTVQNAHTKGKALHKEMQNLVLKDNPSIKGKWADFKVYLDTFHKTGVTLDPVDWSLANIKQGEWDYSTFVMPQHEVDPATGEPLAAIEYQSHLVGADSGTATGSTMGLVKAYGQSRAHVQAIDPAVPATMSTSFFNLLTDSGSQEPELADVIEDENDQPPYDTDEYVGGATNAPYVVMQDSAVASVTHPNGLISGMTAECGLVKLEIVAAKDGTFLPTFPEQVLLQVNLMPGSYKGVAALPMGQ